MTRIKGEKAEGHRALALKASGPNDQIEWVLGRQQSLISDLTSAWYLTDGVPEGGQLSRLLGSPMIEDGLYREFAQLGSALKSVPNDIPGAWEPIAEKQKLVLGFARRHGLLGVAVPIALDGRANVFGIPLSAQGESLSAWEHQSIAMSRALEAWDKLRVPRKEADREVLDHFRSVLSGGWLGRLEAVSSNGDAVLGVAWEWLLREINDRLAVGTRAVLERDDRKRNYLKYESVTLLGSLWLQFAEAVVGNRHWLPCEGCGVMFEVDPKKGGRAGQRSTCSSKCKQAAYRKRKAADGGISKEVSNG